MTESHVRFERVNFQYHINNYYSTPYKFLFLSPWVHRQSLTPLICFSIFLVPCQLLHTFDLPMDIHLTKIMKGNYHSTLVSMQV